MGKKDVTTIDALFGSKTRVKLLHLFLNNPGKAFYVREITRLIDEQINSVRRELANMLNVGVIVSNTADNKLFYEINQQYDFYTPFRAIFANTERKANGRKSNQSQDNHGDNSWKEGLRALKGLRVAIAAGILVEGSASSVDLLIVGNVTSLKVKSLVAEIERSEARELNYTAMSYDEFYYRLSVRDRFISEITLGRHEVIIDKDNVLAE